MAIDKKRKDELVGEYTELLKRSSAIFLTRYGGMTVKEIEARLEELAEVAERCRKIILVSKAAIGGGGVMLLVMMLGLFGSSPAAALGSIALMLGGIVSLGSNVSTLRQTVDAIGAAEALRSDLIGGIDLRVVGDSPMKLT